MTSTLILPRNGAVGFIDWLDDQCAKHTGLSLSVGLRPY
jgi:hypothetical protein